MPVKTGSVEALLEVTRKSPVLIALSDAPGLGVEVKEADLATLPYQTMAYRQYRHADGSWKGW